MNDNNCNTTINVFNNKYSFNNVIIRLSLKYDNDDMRTNDDNVIMNILTFEEIQNIVSFYFKKLIYQSIHYKFMILKYAETKLKQKIILQENETKQYYKNNYDKDIVEYFELPFIIDKNFDEIHKYNTNFLDLINGLGSINNNNNNNNNSIHKYLLNSTLTILVCLHKNINLNSCYNFIKRISNIKLMLNIVYFIDNYVIKSEHCDEIYINISLLIKFFNFEYYPHQTFVYA
jgi:hypothetical protein